MIEAFAGPRFKTGSVGGNPNPARTTLTEILARLRRTEFDDGAGVSDWLVTQILGETYDPAAIRKKVEADYLNYKTGARIIWARGIKFRCWGYYVPEARFNEPLIKAFPAVRGGYRRMPNALQQSLLDDAKTLCQQHGLRLEHCFANILKCNPS